MISHPWPFYGHPGPDTPRLPSQIRALLDGRPSDASPLGRPSRACERTLRAVLQAQARYWPEVFTGAAARFDEYFQRTAKAAAPARVSKRKRIVPQGVD